MNPSEMTNDKIAEAIRALMVEAESRSANHPGVLKWLLSSHACLDRAAERAATAGAIQPMSGGEPKE